ncbi:MAG TPA: SDR family NAD(P)-dependent oxidoreductase [Bryobacteraceae bacterium]|jgi:NAD(P)-dependent dehydrogenase (short-subunit alcohol dehydrogenase family)
MKVDLSNHVALVTGAGAGIGQAIAKALAANGAMVAVNDVAETGDATARDINGAGGLAEFFHCDVADRAGVDRMVDAVTAKFGKIDILVNNAGAGAKPGHRVPLHEFPHEEWLRLIDVDLNSIFYCCRAVSPGMVERRYGSIINIASIVGLVPLRRQIGYAAAKAGVINTSKAAALELGPFGIRVNAIAPGSTLTAGTRGLFYNPENKAVADSLISHIPLGRPGEPEDIANAALFLAAPESSYITGTVVVVDGGWTAGFARDW